MHTLVAYHMGCVAPAPDNRGCCGALAFKSAPEDGTECYFCHGDWEFTFLYIVLECVCCFEPFILEHIPILPTVTCPRCNYTDVFRKGES